MTQPSAKKTILIVDDTPINIGVISGALKDSFATKVANQRRKGAGDRFRERKAGPHSSRHTDARNGRIRSLPPSESKS